MSAFYKAPRAPKANLDTLAGTAGLIPYQHYWLTDVNKLAVATSTTAYIELANTNAFSNTVAGLTPASGGGTTNFLRADGTWAAPAGGGAGASPFVVNTLATITSGYGTVSDSPGPDNYLAGHSRVFLRADGTWSELPIYNGTGGPGLVPYNLPSGKFLKDDGTWANATSSIPDGDKGDITVSVSGTVWTIDDGTITNAKFRQSVGLSVVGNSATGIANVSNITAGTDGHVLRRLGSTLGFGTLAATAFDDNTLPFAKLAGVSAYSLIGNATGTLSSGVAVGTAGLKTILIQGSGGGTVNFLRADGTWGPPSSYTTFTSVASGLVPASGGGTVNFLRADGTWGAPVGTTYSNFTNTVSGLVPASGGGTVNFLRADGAWATAATIIDPLVLSASTTPSTPAGGIKVFGATRSGYDIPMFVDPQGRTERLQNFLGSNKTIEDTVQINTANTSQNGLGWTSLVAPTAAALAITNYATMQPRVVYTIATAGGIVERRGNTPVCSRRSIGGGFHSVSKMCILAAPSDCRLFFGESSTNGAQAAAQPSAMLNMICLGKDTADTALSIMHNDGTGTATKITLTNTGTLTGITNSTWQVEFKCSPGASTIGYRVTRWSDAGVETVDEGVTGTTKLPAIDTLFVPRFWMNAVTAVSTSFGYIKFYMEID